MNTFKNLLVSVFVFNVAVSFGQQNDALAKLNQAFGNELVNYLKTHFPDSLNYYLFVAENGYQVSDKKYLKAEDLNKAIPITLPDNCFNNEIIKTDQINIWALPVSFHPTEKNVYLIEGTNYALIVRSKEYLSKKFQAKPK